MNTLKNFRDIAVISRQGIAMFAFIFIISPFIIISPIITHAAVENLDEVVARRGRVSTATWGPNTMEDTTNSYIWQPESLMYLDLLTGHEVWKMSNTKDLDNYYHDDIGWPQWSANGKWIAFGSTRTTNAFTKTDSTSARIWMIQHTDGSHLMPVIGGSSRRQNSLHPYFHWSPQIPDVYYDTGDTGNGLALKGYDIYKNTVSDSGVTMSFLFTTNQGGGNTKNKKLLKTISGDGLKILLRDASVSSGSNFLYPCTVEPPGSVGCNTYAGYSIDRGQGTGYDNMPASYTREHSGGLFLSGNASMGYYVYLLPSGTSAWWRMPLTGSASDGGPFYTAPGTSGEVVIETTKDATCPPWTGHTYWSHVTPDWWGTHVVFSDTEDCNVAPNGQPGVAHINAVTHTYDTRSFLNDYGVQHNDWHGFTDYTVSSYEPYNTPNDGLGRRITSQRYNDTTKTDITTVNLTHTYFNGGSSYNGWPRPAESPDGTKVMWTSEFLNATADHQDIFWSVVRYPKPPIGITAVKNGSNVRLSWTRPSYTTRGWPNETTDSPPTSKEIKGYHVWISNDGNTGWKELTTNAVTTEFYDIIQGNNTTQYYAVTSEEYSRLESRTLSAIRQVTLDANGNLTTSQSAIEGKTGFWTTKPLAPNPSTFAIAAGGPYRLTWLEPNGSKIRYYNIYYSSSSASVPTDQQHRIASVPVGTTTYLDWLADTSKPGYYKITSVDRQGNEGTWTPNLRVQ